MALLQITDASGRQWRYTLTPDVRCTIGRAPDNCVTLNDPRASRYHAYVRHEGGAYLIVDGALRGTEIKRSANRVLINGQPHHEHRLAHGDQITIGASQLVFMEPPVERAARIAYSDRPLGRTQLTVSGHEVIREALHTQESARLPAEELATLRRKAERLALLYELSQRLGSTFDLDAIFDKATEIILRVTPADRVVALLKSERDEAASLRPVGARLRHEGRAAHATVDNISRTITSRVMTDRMALLTQDATADSQLAHVKSIIAQGVRSTICAPLLTESGVYGVLYADRLDPLAQFTRDDLELVSAIAAQTSVAVETVRAHDRLAREEVARANYSRFLPDYVVRQLLEHPDSFRLGGVNQTVTILFADVRGFTRLAEHAPPEEVVRLLNRYFSAMTDVIFGRGGTLDKYIGDGLMALFGAPASTPDDVSNAVAAAVAMQGRVQQLNAELRAEGRQEIGVGIGLHTGEATVGYIGSERRTEYTAIGDTVNLAARLEQNARSGQVLLSEAVVRAAACPYPLREHPPLTVKNRVQPVQVYEVEWQPSGTPQG